MRSTQVRELRSCSSFRIFFFPYFAWKLCAKKLFYYFNYFYNITFVITFFKMFPKCHLFCVIYGKKRSRWLSKIQSKNCEEFLESQPSSSLSYVTFTSVGDSPFLWPVSRQWPCWQGETSRYVLEQNDQQQRTGRKRQKDPEASYVCVCETKTWTFSETLDLSRENAVDFYGRNCLSTRQTTMTHRQLFHHIRNSDKGQNPPVAPRSSRLFSQ